MSGVPSLARWMDPATGTFLSVDPVVPRYDDPQSLNAYAYARNNPVNLTDPNGMCVLMFSCGMILPAGFSVTIPTLATTTSKSLLDFNFDLDGGTLVIRPEGQSSFRVADSGSVASDAGSGGGQSTGSPSETGSPAASVDPDSKAASILGNQQLADAASSAISSSVTAQGGLNEFVGTGFRPDGSLTESGVGMGNGIEIEPGGFAPRGAKGLAGIGVAAWPWMRSSQLSTSEAVATRAMNASINAGGVPVFVTTVKSTGSVLIVEPGFAPVFLPSGLPKL